MLFLKNLDCSFNSLISLDLSKNLLLSQLDAKYNSLQTLNLDNNHNLRIVEVNSNDLTVLTLDNCELVIDLDVNNNQLTSLDLRNDLVSTHFINFNSTNNPDLICIDVDSTNYFESNTNFLVDSWNNFSVDCSSAFGCMDTLACNYNASFTIDNGSCSYISTSDTSVTACDSYDWNDSTYTSSGSYTYTIGAIPDLPANRGQSPAVVGYNNKLYVFGGKYGGGPTPPYSTYNTGLTYDLGTRTWSNISPTMSVGRAWVDGAIWQDKVYIYSGTDDQTSSSHQSMEIYDITNDSFSTVATPDKRTNYAAGAINGKIYICGGYSYGVGEVTRFINRI